MMSDRITSLAKRLAEGGLLEKPKDGHWYVFRFSDWFRARFPVLIGNG